jgi:hypothetical protein
MSATWTFRRQPDLVKVSTLAALTAAIAFVPTPLRADQGGISFWPPGAFGSLAATPVTPEPPQFEGLWGIRREESPQGLERVADPRNLAIGRNPNGGKADDQKIATSDVGKNKRATPCSISYEKISIC